MKKVEQTNPQAPVALLESRIAETKDVIERIEAERAAAETEWRNAIAADDTKRETTAARRVREATDAMSTARDRIRILEGALQQARRDVLPQAATIAACHCCDLNRGAALLAEEALTHYAAFREAAASINALAAQHRAVIDGYRKQALEAGAVKHNGAFETPIPSGTRFAVALSELNRFFKPEFDRRFLLDPVRLMPGGGAAKAESEAAHA